MIERQKTPNIIFSRENIKRTVPTMFLRENIERTVPVMFFLENIKRTVPVMFAMFLVCGVLAFTACGGGQAAPQGQGAEAEAPNVVELTVPAVFFDGDDGFDMGGGGLSPGGGGLKAGDDLADYIRENDFIDAKWNGDGSLTIAMSLQRFETFKKDMVDNTTRALSDIVEDEAYPFVLGFEAAPEFKTVTMLVDRTGFELSGAGAGFLPILVGITVGMYRGFVGEDEFYTVVIADAKTGDTIEWLDFPVR